MIRNALRGSATYAAVAVVQRGIVFLLLPVYTRALSPAEYGELGVLLAVVMAGNLLFSFGLDFTLIRQWFQLADDPGERQRWLHTMGWFVLVAPLLAALICAPPVLIFGPEVLEVRRVDLILGLLSSATFVGATTMPFALLRAEERLVDFVRLSAINGLVTTVGTVAAVVYFDLGVTGWISSLLAANLITLAGAMLILPWPWSANWWRDHVKQALMVGLPLLPHVLSQWGLQFASRTVLVGLVSKAQIGFFTIAWTLALPVTILATALNQGLLPTYGRASKDPDARARLGRVATYQVAIVGMLGLGAALLLPILCELVLPRSYGPAAGLVPWLVAANTLFGCYYVPVTAVSIVAGHTRGVWVATLVAAGSAIGLIYLLVPAHGLKGAVVAVVAGYGLLLLGTATYCSRVASRVVRYEWSTLGRLMVAIAVIYGGAVLTSGRNDLADLSIRLAWLGLLPAALIASGVLSIDLVRTGGRVKHWPPRRRLR